MALVGAALPQEQDFDSADPRPHDLASEEPGAERVNAF